MCRLMMYLGKPIVLHKLLIDPANSLINQSMHSRSKDTPVNGDGFGLVWYVPEISFRPGLFRSLTPAWSNNNLVRMARVTRSGTVLAHVRAASAGIESSEQNCHPFTHEQFAFAHNGDLTCFSRVRRLLESTLSQEAYDLIRGGTDSEHLFAMFVDELRGLGAEWGSGRGEAIEREGGDPRAEMMAAALRGMVARVMELVRGAGEERNDTYLNIAITDGERGVACRFSTDSDENTPTLFVYRHGVYSCEGGVCRLDRAGPGSHDGAVVVSSEALTDASGWEEVPLNSMVVISTDRGVAVRPMGIA